METVPRLKVKTDRLKKPGSNLGPLGKMRVVYPLHHAAPTIQMYDALRDVQ